LAQCAIDSVVGGVKGCSGLAVDGRRQAERLRDRLLRTGELAETDAVYTSVLPRAIETAEIIAPGLGAGGESPAKQESDLCELDPGEADGLTWEEYRDRYNIDMGANPYEAMAPGGESIANFLLRVGRALTSLVAAHPDQTVVVAGHGGLVWGSMHVFSNLPLRASAVFEVENTSITEWRISTPRCNLVRFNDFAHLQR
jgi:broad specificity phosphatase PhoE